MFMHGWNGRKPDGDPVIWRRRRYNSEADYLANHAMDYFQDFSYEGQGLFHGGHGDEVCLMGWSDGGHRYHGVSGGGWLIKAWNFGESQPRILVAKASFYDDATADSYVAEAKSLLELIKGIESRVAERCP